MPDLQDDGAARLAAARASRIAAFRDGLPDGTAEVEKSIHSAGISPFAVVEWFVSDVIGKRRTEWIETLNSTPTAYVDVVLDNKTVQRRPITSTQQQNNWALTRNLMNIFTAQPLWAAENVIRAILNQPLKKWETRND